MNHGKHITNQGFTLVEMLVVIAILALVSALVVPQFASASGDAQISSAASTVRRVQEQIEVFRATQGQYPAVIAPSWFAGDALPRNPFAPEVQDSVYYDSSNSTTKTHPTIKDLRDESIKVYWYNPLNGRFRARVTHMSSDEESLDLYNQVHASNLTLFNQTTD